MGVLNAADWLPLEVAEQRVCLGILDSLGWIYFWPINLAVVSLKGRVQANSKEKKQESLKDNGGKTKLEKHTLEGMMGEVHGSHCMRWEGEQIDIG